MKLRHFLSGFLLTGLFFISHSGLASSLDNWHWRNPVPNGNPASGPHTLYGVTYGDGKFVGVGDSGVASISTDNTNWIEGTTATANTLNAVIYAHSQFIAVGNGGTVETSLDGTNWTSQFSGTTNSLVAIAYANGKFVAVGAKAIISSPDAVHWSPSVSGLTGATSIAGSDVGFIAIADDANAYFSTDGLAWTTQVLTAPGNSYFGASLQNSIVTYTKGSFFIGSYRYSTGTSADMFIFSSTDGNTWATNLLGNITTGAFGFTYNFFVDGNGEIFASGTANLIPFLQISPDGINWFRTNGLPYGGPANGTLYAGAYGNNSYVILSAAILNHYAVPPIFVSPDGINWTNRQRQPMPPTGPTNMFSSIAFTNGVYVVAASDSVVRSTDGMLYSTNSGSPAISSVIATGTGFAGVGAGGKIFVSGDGLSWTQRNSGTVNNLHGITSGGGLLIAVGDNGTIQTSPTGTIWTSRTSGTSLSLSSITYANGLFVTVGQMGTVLTSPDGINWTGQDSGQLSNLLSVTYGSAGFAAAGSGGLIVTSPDGVNWTTQNSGTQTNLESVTFGNGYYLATGDGSIALISPDGINWLARNLGATGGQNFYGAAFLNGRFDVVGSYGTILESDTVAPLFDVQIHAHGNWLTAFAPTGSSFRIQASTNLVNPTWIDAASFNNVSAITQWTNTAAGSGQLFYRAVSP